MPKTSAIERNKKRIKLSAKFAAKRAELKAILANPPPTDDEFFAAQKKLQKLPQNSSPSASATAAPERPPARLHRASSACRASPSASSPSPARSRRHQILLVNFLATGLCARRTDMTRAAAKKHPP
jgi:hypothetical protein